MGQRGSSPLMQNPFPSSDFAKKNSKNLYLKKYSQTLTLIFRSNIMDRCDGGKRMYFACPDSPVFGKNLPATATRT